MKGIEVWQRSSNLIFCFNVHFQKACLRLLPFGFNKFFVMGRGCQLCAQPQTWRTRVPLFSGPSPVTCLTW